MSPLLTFVIDHVDPVNLIDSVDLVDSIGSVDFIDQVDKVNQVSGVDKVNFIYQVNVDPGQLSIKVNIDIVNTINVDLKL